MALINVEQLCVDTRLKSVSFAMGDGDMIGLIGPNGAGKSTLLNTLAGLEDYSGEIILDDKPLGAFSSRQRGQLIGLQPQYLESAWSISVQDVVALGRIPWGDHDEAAIQQAMDYTGVTDFAERPVDHLSGGERARVWLARVLAGKPRVLLVDEPVANLDLHYQVTVMEILRAYAEEQGQAVMVALHDLGLAARFCNKLCLLHEGNKIALGTPAEVLDEEQLARVYGIPVEVDLERSPPVVLPR